MKYSFGGVSAILPALLLLAAPDSPAQRYTDPDTLAPAFPTPQIVVDHMLDLAQVKPNETVYDLGCGDGRIVITAAQKFRAHGVGIEIRRDIYEATLGKVNSLGLSEQVKIIHGNALKTDLRPADVVTLYLLTSSNEKLRPVLEKGLNPNARVVSHDFEIRGWKPAKIEKMMVEGRPHTIYLYRVADK
ncbi:MAG: methyltransferase domain-containing protein [Acidobacteriota bacterium]